MTLTTDNLNTNCCTTAKPSDTNTSIVMACPISGQKGKEIKLITLKSLLIPAHLAELDPTQTYYFCKDADCDVVYFSQTQAFTKQHLKVKVHQKEIAKDVPVCYCFDWTPQSIAAAADASTISSSINEHIKAGRCGCEVNNPQGSCCLGNVNAEIKRLTIKVL